MKNGCYIAGRMRGVRHYNFEQFHRAEAWLERNTTFGPIFNPARRDEDLGFKPIEWDLTGHEDLTEPIVVGEGIECFVYIFDLDAAMEADNDFIRSDECAVIVMLPGWSKSRGARDEKALAESLSKKVVYLRLDYNGRFAYLWHVPEPEDESPSQPAAPEALKGEVRHTSPTGGQKGVKPERHELIPGRALDYVARVYAFGAAKYSDHNWRKGYPWSQSLGAKQRHTNALKKNEWLDAESGLPHLAHDIFHALSMLEWWAEGNTDQNDIHGLDLPEAS